MKHFLLRAIFIMIFLQACVCTVFAEDTPVFSVYPNGLDYSPEHDEFVVEEDMVFDTEPDYSDYEELKIDFAHNPKDYELEPNAKIYMLHTSTDKMLDNIHQSKSLYYSVDAYDDSDYRKEQGLSAKIATKKMNIITGFSQRSFDGHNAIENRIFVAPELKLTKNLSIKTKLTHNVENNTEQSHIGLNYKCPQSKSDLQFELRSGAVYKEKIINSQSVQFVTKFKI